jgi:hypothetical protein
VSIVHWWGNRHTPTTPCLFQGFSYTAVAVAVVFVSVLVVGNVHVFCYTAVITIAVVIAVLVSVLMK